MSESPLSQVGEEAFIGQILGYLDGTASPQDQSELKEALASRPALRPLFVSVIRLHGALTELLSPQRVALPSAVAAPPRSAPGEETPPTEPAHPPSDSPGGRRGDDTCEYVEDRDEDTTQ